MGKSPVLSFSQLRRVQTGLHMLFWAFLFMFLFQACGLMVSSAFGGMMNSFGWFSTLPAVLGFLAAAKMRGVVTELLEGAPEEQQRKQEEEAFIVPREEKPKAGAAPWIGGLELQRMSKEETKAEGRTMKKAEKQEPSYFEKVDWEEWVGKKLLQKVGILIVLIGMVVFLKYSFDNHLIGELGRIGLSSLAAIILLGAGEWFHRSYKNWSQAFTGAGLALLYFTVWAAHVFYKEELLAQHGLSVSPALAMGLYSLITLIGAIASIRYRAQTIAWFATLGGYCTPLLIETPEPNVANLTVYLVILAGGVLALSWHQRWKFLPLAAFGFTQLYLFALVYPSLSLSDVRQTIIAIGFFILFALPPLLSQFRLQRPAAEDDIVLILLDGAAAFIATVDASGGWGGHWVGLISLLLAAIYIAFAGAALHRRAEDDLLVNTYLLAGIGLTALALYAQMKWEWVAAGWAPFSLLLLFVAIRLERRSVFDCALALLVGSLAFLVANLPFMQEGMETLWHPFTSHWALLSYVVFACLLGWIASTRSLPKSLQHSEELQTSLLPGLHMSVVLILFAAVTFEVTGLHWVITLPLAISYLAFSAIAIVVFALTEVSVWFIAAFLAQFLVILFTFVFGKTSGMVSPLLDGRMVFPLFHPWAAVSALSILVTAAFLVVVIKRGSHWLNTVQTRGLLIAVAAAQIWVHGTVEIQHMQSLFSWSDLVFNRALSAWWILFTVPLFVWGIRSGRQMVLRAAIAALCIPLGKDLLLMYGGRADIYEVSLWTVIPLIAVTVASHRALPDLLMAGCSMLAAVMAVDMLHTLATDAGVLRTVWWAVVGLLTISLGFFERERTLRRLAIGVFAATVAKLLLFDFAALSTGVRIIASILTGLLLIGASYLYQRFDSLLARR